MHRVYTRTIRLETCSTLATTPHYSILHACRPNHKNWTFFRFSITLLYCLAYSYSRRVHKRYTNHYKHSMSNGIWVQLVMRFWSKRMFVVYTPLWFIQIHSFSVFYDSQTKKNSKVFGRRRIRSEKRLFSIVFFCWMLYKFYKTTKHNASRIYLREKSQLLQWQWHWLASFIFLVLRQIN